MQELVEILDGTGLSFIKQTGKIKAEPVGSASFCALNPPCKTGFRLLLQQLPIPWYECSNAGMLHKAVCRLPAPLLEGIRFLPQEEKVLLRLYTCNLRRGALYLSFFPRLCRFYSEAGSLFVRHHAGRFPYYTTTLIFLQ